MVQGPNDLEALKNLLPTPPANTVNNEAQNRRKRQNGTETPLIPLVDTVQISSRAVRAAEQAAVQRNAVAGPLNTAPRPGIAPNAPIPVPSRAANPLLGVPPTGAPATVTAGNTPAPRAEAQVWAASPVRRAIENEPEVRPDRVAQAAQGLADLDNQGAGLDAKIAEKLLTGF